MSAQILLFALHTVFGQAPQGEDATKLLLLPPQVQGLRSGQAEQLQDALERAVMATGSFVLLDAEDAKRELIGTGLAKLLRRCRIARCAHRLGRELGASYVVLTVGRKVRGEYELRLQLLDPHHRERVAEERLSVSQPFLTADDLLRTASRALLETTVAAQAKAETSNEQACEVRADDATWSLLEGDCEDGLAEGKGKAVRTDSSARYEGEFQQGRFHGKGTWVSANGNTYVGEFKDGKCHGYGTQGWSNGAQYVGSYADDAFSGRGTLTWANGTKYVGEFEKGQMHGSGTMTWPNGAMQVGTWENGVYVGPLDSSKTASPPTPSPPSPAAASEKSPQPTDPALSESGENPPPPIAPPAPSQGDEESESAPSPAPAPSGSGESLPPPVPPPAPGDEPTDSGS